MNSVTLENYRCFRGKQTARLAPLTLLVGENSSGKTAFMAMIRALRRAAFANRMPDFQEPPYDMGSFGEVVYNDSLQSAQLDFFRASFEDGNPDYGETPVEFSATFEDRNGSPFPSVRKFSQGDAWFKFDDRSASKIAIGVGGHSRSSKNPSAELDVEITLLPIVVQSALQRWTKGDDAPFPSEDAAKSLLNAFSDTLGAWQARNITISKGKFSETFASAPVRSQPQRAYAMIPQPEDPAGEYIPSYLASLSHYDSDEWSAIKKKLEIFGRTAGLFDEISIGSLGEAGYAFDVRIRKFGKELKGRDRNLIDVGHGVSQALPLLTELFRPDAPPVFLLQQPEVHLHPMAQAALGSLFCSIAPERQVIVETHSDYIMDRVRIDVRDGKTELKPDDVSILFFERGDLDARIHSIRIDKDGNVLDAPESYGKFFMEETRRVIGR